MLFGYVAKLRNCGHIMSLELKVVIFLVADALWLHRFVSSPINQRLLFPRAR